MRVVWISLFFVSCSIFVVRAFEDNTLEDDDFAEFEQFDADDDVPSPSQSKPEFHDDHKDPMLKVKEKDQFDSNIENEDEGMVEDEDNEFEHFQDPEEFEGFQENIPHSSEQPKITISKVPITVRPRWDAYWLEGILCCALVAYALVYAVGRSKNTSIAMNFLKLHKPLLDDNFTLVGETGADVVSLGEAPGWRREAEHCFSMWCSGRLCCEGMLLTLKLIKRQDLVHVLLGIVRPSPDTLLIRVELDKDDCDPFVLCVAQKKIATRLAKEMQDLSVFCPERRAGDKHGLPGALCVLSESAEAAAAVLDSRTVAALHQYHHHVQYIHVSDRYSGPKQMEETTVTKPPETERLLLVSLALGPDGGGAEVRPLLLLVFHLMDRLKRIRLSKEALAKCEKRRQKVAEAWVRGAHAARQEQAAQRREERRKQEKERILAVTIHRHGEQAAQRREERRKQEKERILAVTIHRHGVRGSHAARQEQAAQRREERRKQEKERILAVTIHRHGVRGAHAARQEQAAQRREERRKQEKERILAEQAAQRREERRKQEKERILAVTIHRHGVRGSHAARQEQAAQRREERRKQEKERILAVTIHRHGVRGAHAARQEQAAQRREERRKQEKERILAVTIHRHGVRGAGRARRAAGAGRAAPRGAPQAGEGADPCGNYTPTRGAGRARRAAGAGRAAPRGAPQAGEGADPCGNYTPTRGAGCGARTPRGRSRPRSAARSAASRRRSGSLR
ncbi:hypothetical protein ACJJTC_002496 [Scirpophaga incertulas]